ncbi:peptidase m24 methionine aminopeptidase [Lucifera butyrica]|uniref:Peptidase m24 methionine aminopeptidase n=1 Tax=Lucifera butyrica TaxID=1351585 RepID=A0A498R510_9FIRM|nr:Xaa-Pro peptidase family protein [Lucifera butyrica]VBB05907.1 peptidase m24 methionine aminopeptidase [Lucifera butyrica]
MNKTRLNKVLQAMAEQNVPQMVISDPAAIFYLTGKWIYPGERMLVLYLSLSGNHKLFINELFPLPEDLGVEKVWFNDIEDGVAVLSRYIGKAKTIGIDKNWPAHFLLRLMEQQKDKAFVNGSGILDRLRMYKDEQERNLMREASRINDLAIGQLIQLISPQHSEKKLSHLLGEIYETLDAEGYSFEPIIAYGANAADSHHIPGNSRLKAGDCVLIDIGCRKNSYCSDMTRTVFYKHASDHARKVYNLVVEANQRAIEIIKPGVRFCDIDAAARSCIETAGYGKGFVNRTGHSIGLETHDFGDVSAVNTAPVEAGMIFSIEPSIKIPGELGIRVEDLVLVTADGCEVLNQYPRELMIVE